MKMNDLRCSLIQMIVILMKQQQTRIKKLKN
jgi:hypothetical protein